MSAPWTCGKDGCVHERCHAHKQNGEPCGQPPMRGSTVCRKHGGKAPQVMAKAAERTTELEVREAANRLGVPIEVDPGEALLAMVYEAAGNVAFYRSLIQDLPAHPVLVADEDPSEELEPQPHGGALKRRHDGWALIRQGIYGPDHLGDQRTHVLVQMYDAERDRLAQVSALAIKAGIDERRLALAEADVARLFDAVIRAMTVLPSEHREPFRVALAHELRA